MARDGAGNYNLPAGNPVVTGTTISSSVNNTTDSDIATALSSSIAKDGQTIPTANLPMGGFKHTNVADATVVNQYLAAGQLASGAVTYLTAVSGTNTIVGTNAPAISAYAAGQAFRFTPAATNTGAATLNINGLGAKNIFYEGVALVAGEIQISVPVEIIYDGTQFNLVSPSAILAPVNRQGANIASAATVNLETATGEYVHITGTTTITAVTLSQGHQRAVVFDGALSITNGASLILPGGQNITTTAGTMAIFVGEAAGVVRCIYISSSAVSGITSVRQTFLGGKTDVNGYANWLSAGAALNFNVAAATTQLTMTFSNGFTTSGSTDSITQLAADASNQGVLSANGTNYISATSSGISAVTWGNTLAPPQYGYSFDQTKQSLMRFVGPNAGTTFLDDYGNTWAAAGGAKISTATLIDTLNTLLLGGAGDWAENTTITTLGSGSWSIEAKFRFAVLPTAGNNMAFFIGTNAGGFGVGLFLNNAAGTLKTLVNLSANGTSTDIAAAALGIKTVWATATTYHVALTFDALAGKYFVYVDGVLDTTATNVAKICSITKTRLGDSGGGSSSLNGNIAGFRFLPYCAYPNGTTFTIPTISTFTVSGVTSSDWYSIPDGKMYGPTTASASAGANPTFTAKNLIYGGEQDTNASVVTATRNYAYQGKYDSVLTAALAISTAYSFTHNLGVTPRIVIGKLVNTTTDNAYAPGEEMAVPNTTFDGTAYFGFSQFSTQNTATFAGGTRVLTVAAKAGGAAVNLTMANWKLKISAQRGF